jgi:hypothetical protein
LGEDPDVKEMMLDTDLCLIWEENIDYENCLREDPTNRANEAICEDLNDPQTLFAKTDACCAWADTTLLFQNHIYDADDVDNIIHCGANFDFHEEADGERIACCAYGTADNGLRQDCQGSKSPTGPAADAVLFFARAETAFYNKFMLAWNIATTNGYSDLEQLVDLEVPDNTYDCDSYSKKECVLDTLYCSWGSGSCNQI